MYDGRAEARMREQEYWNNAMYRKQKNKDWDGDMKQEQSARRLKQNNEDRNLVRDLRGHLEVLEGNDIASEVSGDCQSLGEW